MEAMRDKDQADYDLEKMFEMLDTAMTSKDERVQNAFRALLTIIALTKPQDDGEMAATLKLGPLRRMQEDLQDLSRRMWNIQSQVDQLAPKIGQGIGGGPWGGSGGTNPYTGGTGYPWNPTYSAGTQQAVTNGYYTALQQASETK